MKHFIPCRSALVKCLSVTYFLLLALTLAAQPKKEIVKVIVAPDHINWEYKTGEPVKFTITVLQYDNPLPNAKIKYEIMPEKMTPTKKETLSLPDGRKVVEGGTLNKPGFLRCIATAMVDGKEYVGLATAGIEPLKIDPTTNVPADFQAFWDKAKAEAAKIPLDARMTLLPERCTETVNVYHVNLQNSTENTRLYGILCVPKKEGKYPAILKVPGAGARPYYGDVEGAEKGFITFEIGIHGVPVTMDVSVYNNLMAGALRGYWTNGLDDKDKYYYKRVYLGCVRANDFIFSLPQFDGQNLGVTGGSQGGALSIITAALDNRVKFLAAFYPALSDLTGYLHDRAGGWPHLFNKDNYAFNAKKDKIETSKYYDVVNFARLLKIPGYYSWGFNDETCPPTSMYAAYNVIKAPKELFLALDTGHWTYPEQGQKANSWLYSKLQKSK
ncbi:acetylxylan esterase [Adhaeribacter radiodurans]|uniref:Acetylxylan esterase n=1 Tax=Adhaeribacter radiodurans TaxID=2745197 RepID=A0A7L7L9Y9_9BACT|nr:acetylxylan esterase [Adhaeribacter radiodurans]QMU29640.1 acetylxylan esterase [Adhaeribacter radiodurans]